MSSDRGERGYHRLGVGVLLGVLPLPSASPIPPVGPACGEFQGERDGLSHVSS